MSEALFPYYARELLFVRELTREFARQYPAAAARLFLERDGGTTDAHVGGVMESFALLAGGLHQKLDDEFPELTEALLGILYPHYLAPVPSMAVLQFELDPARGQLPAGFLIAKGSRLYTQAIEGVPCKFRTGYPVNLWPIRLTAARLQSPPFPPGLQVPQGARSLAILRLQFECAGGLNFGALTLDRLRFYLHGDSEVVPLLYELLFNHAIEVHFAANEPGRGPSPLALKPAQTLFQVGFEKDDSLLPYAPRSMLGYRLLTEFFAFPAKFLFLDLGGWKQARRAGCTGNRLEVVVFLNRTAKNVEQAVDAGTFRLGCAPVVNLFEPPPAPLALTQGHHEYRILADTAQPLGIEVYSVESVTSTDPATNRTTEYPPFYSFRHPRTQEGAQTFWYASRRPTTAADDRGSEVYLNLVDLDFDPHLPADLALMVRTICTNRNLPVLLQKDAETAFALEATAPLTGIHCLRLPTTPLRPPPRRGGAWRLVSHLTLNHLSLTDPVEGLEALHDILRLYDFSDPEAGQQQLAAVTRELVDGIVSLQTRRVVGQVGEAGGGFCRGIEVTLEFDEEKYVGTGVFLFASVLERFLGLYVSVNSFSQLVGKIRGAGSYFKKWPPRAGELPLV